MHAQEKAQAEGQRGRHTETVVQKSETIAFRKSRSATAMRINPFTDGLKGEGPSARALTPSVLRAMPVRSVMHSV